jgi:hypothetical protein
MSNSKNKSKYRMFLTVEEIHPPGNPTVIVEEIDLGDFATEDEATAAMETILELAGYEEEESEDSD